MIITVLQVGENHKIAVLSVLINEVLKQKQKADIVDVSLFKLSYKACGFSGFFVGKPELFFAKGYAFDEE